MPVNSFFSWFRGPGVNAAKDATAKAEIPTDATRVPDGLEDLPPSVWQDADAMQKLWMGTDRPDHRDYIFKVRDALVREQPVTRFRFSEFSQRAETTPLAAFDGLVTDKIFGYLDGVSLSTLACVSQATRKLVRVPDHPAYGERLNNRLENVFSTVDEIALIKQPWVARILSRMSTLSLTQRKNSSADFRGLCRAINQANPNITTLSLTLPGEMDDEDYKAVLMFKHLERLVLNAPMAANDRAFCYSEAHPSLRDVEYNIYVCMDGGRRPIGPSAALRRFTISCSDVFELEGLDTLPAHLEALTVRAGDEWGCFRRDGTDALGANLAKLTHLQTLIYERGLDGPLAALALPRSIEHLEIIKPVLTDDDVAYLKTLSNLKNLKLTCHHPARVHKQLGGLNGACTVRVEEGLLAPQ